MQFTRTHFYLAVTVLIAGVRLYSLSLGVVNMLDAQRLAGATRVDYRFVSAQEAPAPTPPAAESEVVAPDFSGESGYRLRREMSEDEDPSFMGMDSGFSDLEAAPGTQTAFIAKTRSMGKNACAEPFKRITIPAVPAKSGQKAIPATSKCVLEQDVVLDETAEVSSFTTVDCQGHKLTPSAVGSGSGDTLVRSVPEAAFVLNDVYGTTLKNCDLSGFDFGIFITGGKVTEEMAANEAVLDYNANKINNNTILARFQGLTLISADNNRIDTNIVTTTSSGGVGLMAWSDSDLNQIRNNTVTGSGIELSSDYTPMFPGCPIGQIMMTWGDGIILRNSPMDSLVYNFKVGDALVQIPYSGESAEGNLVEGNTLNVPFARGVAVFGDNRNSMVRANTVVSASYGILANGLRSQSVPLPGTCTQDTGFYCLADSDCPAAGDTCNSGGHIERDFRPTDLIVENNILTGIITSEVITMQMASNPIIRGNNANVSLVKKPYYGISLSQSSVEGAIVTRNSISGVSSTGLMLSEMGSSSFGAKISLNDFNMPPDPLKPLMQAVNAGSGYEFPSELSVEGKGNYYGRACGANNRVILGMPRGRLGVSCADALTCWAVGKSGEILKTVDGGYNWVEQNMGGANPLQAVSFADLNTGYAVGDKGLILKTSDGGTTWTKAKDWNADGTGNMPQFYSPTYGIPGTPSVANVPFRLSEISSLRDVSFVDANTGWAVGWKNHPLYAMDEIILKTVDGGAHWTQQDLGYYGTHHAMFYGAKFTDSMNGYITGTVAGWCNPLNPVSCDMNSGTWKSSNTNSVFKTTDGGATWTRTNNSVNYPGANLANKVDCTSPSDCYAAGSGIYKTTNAGASWARVTPDFTANDVKFFDANNGWAVGAKGHLYKTANAGATWTKVVRSGSSFVRVAMGSVSNIALLDVSGYLHVTKDGGATWKSTATVSGIPPAIIAPTSLASTHPMVTDSHRYSVSVANTPDENLPAQCTAN